MHPRAPAAFLGGVRKGVLTLLAALAAVAAVLPGRAEGALTANRIRIGDHPAFVRVVIDFSGGVVRQPNVFATDPGPFFDGLARVQISKNGIDTDAAAKTAFGVHASLMQQTNRIALRLSAADRRFKYLAYDILHAPERLVLDLWKARPPVPGAVFTSAPQGGCLTIGSHTVGAGTANASGTEHGLFEHMFQVTLRKTGGLVARTVGVASSGGNWNRTFMYSVAAQQAGTLEAVDLSEKDGSLICIAQVRVTLRPPP